MNIVWSLRVTELGDGSTFSVASVVLARRTLIFIPCFSRRSGTLRTSCGPRPRPLEIDGGAQQVQMAGVADQPDVADAAEAVTALHDPEAALDGGPDRGDRLVEPALPRLQRLVAGRRRPRVSQTSQTVWKRSGELAFDGIKSRRAVAICEVPHDRSPAPRGREVTGGKPATLLHTALRRLATPMMFTTRMKL
jgi:hypothetical protein